MARVYSSGFEFSAVTFHWWNRLWWKIKALKKPKLKWYRLEIRGPSKIAINGTSIKINKNGYVSWYIMAQGSPLNYLKPAKCKCLDKGVDFTCYTCPKCMGTTSKCDHLISS